MNPTQKFRKTKKGVLTNIYNKMKERSINRGMELPDFTLSEFHSIYLEDIKFNRLFTEWELSGYDTLKKPSIDRINNKSSYTLKNINFMTWRDNRFKQSMERRIRGKYNILMKKDGVIINVFKSVKEAVKKTGLNQSGISSCLSNRYATTGGFEFEYEIIGNIHEKK